MQPGGAGGGGSTGMTGNSGSGAGIGPWWGFACPGGPYAANPLPSDAAVQRVEGVPPSDDFVAEADNLVILEGPVWYGGELFLSQIDHGPLIDFGGGGGGFDPGDATPKAAPPARVLKVTDAGQVSIVLPEAGSNGLALSPSGNLALCSHKTGSVAQVDANGASLLDLASMYMGSRFNSPNDLAFGPDGSLYFTDPDYQAPSPTPQAATRVYHVAPGAASVTALVDERAQPNGVTFSVDGKTLYVSASDGVLAYPVMADGSLGAGTRFASTRSDGMGMDCAGNLYMTSNQSVIIADPTGTEIGRIMVPGVQAVSNIAFGGAEHRTIYITAQGSSASGSAPGLFKITGSIPGMPY